VSFEAKTSRVLPHPCKQNHQADDEAENAVKENLQQIPVSKEIVEGRTESTTKQSNSR